MIRLFCLLFALAPAATAQHAPETHVLPFPTESAVQHTIELSIGETGTSEPSGVFSVRVVDAPSWLVFTVPSAIATEGSETAAEPAARLSFAVAPSAPVGEAEAVVLSVTDADGTERARHVTRMVVAEPELTLSAPWPNPSRGGATVAWTQPEGSVRVSVIDMLGREVTVLVDGEQAAGRYEARVGAGQLAVGSYLVRVETGTERLVSRLTVIR